MSRAIFGQGYYSIIGDGLIEPQIADSLDVLETTIQTSVIPPILKYRLIVTM